MRRSIHETRGTVVGASSPPPSQEGSRPTGESVPSLNTDPDNPTPHSFHCHATQYCACPVRFRYTRAGPASPNPAAGPARGRDAMHHGDRRRASAGSRSAAGRRARWSTRRTRSTCRIRRSRARSSWSTAPVATPITTSRRAPRRGFLAGALDNTIIVAPHFIAGTDKPAANEIMWPDAARTRGDRAECRRRIPTISSFDFVDEIVRKLADKKIFPNLTKIVVAGHSAGGQFATRYEMANKVHGTPGVSITYVVANPSSYAWPAAVRPLPTGDADPGDGRQGGARPGRREGAHALHVRPFDATKAPQLQPLARGTRESHRLRAGCPTSN